jgi:methyltransferase (TIGR00027 family)
MYVAMGRARAHARGDVRGYSDPFALNLLPPQHRAAVEHDIRGDWPRGRELLLRLIARSAERLMGPRTAEIDEGLRELSSGVQLVLLGAGLDARAYRMPELSESIVFEVDHPATQAYKRAQTTGLRPAAREVRYVPVDFGRDRLGEALEQAGHLVDVPTAWVFEGVISYLRPRDVEASLDVIAARSAPRSRLFATYNEPTRLRPVVTWLMRRAREPARAVFSPREMRLLLEGRGFVVRSDRDGFERAVRWNPSPSPRWRSWFRFHHVVIADFVGG